MVLVCAETMQMAASGTRNSFRPAAQMFQGGVQDSIHQTVRVARRNKFRVPSAAPAAFASALVPRMIPAQVALAILLPLICSCPNETVIHCGFVRCSVVGVILTLRRG